jgi:hypothetical protein
MIRRRTRAEAEIQARLESLDPASKRFHVLAAARDFKASWVQLGQRLTEVRESGLYRNWGYTEFETYCRRELHLKNDTANKLTRSYSFLRDHEPRALEQRSERELPPLDVVDLLSQARDRSKVSVQDLEGIRREVFDAESIPTKSQVVKRFRELDPDAFRPPPRPPPDDRTVEMRKALLLAERLQGLLEVLPGISHNSLAGARSVAAELRAMLERERNKKSA